MPPIRILIVDDHAMLRAGLKLLIETQEDLMVVGEAADLRSAIEMARITTPDVISLDLSMPGASGVASVKQLKEVAPDARILVLTMHDDPAYFRSAIAMGAVGYVVKSTADTELITAIRAVSMGRMFVNMFAQNMNAESAASARASIDGLSEREREVMIDVARGHTNQEIAVRIGRSIKTVESYRARMMNKLGLKSRVELHAIAVESGLLGERADVPPKGD